MGRERGEIGSRGLEAFDENGMKIELEKARATQISIAIVVEWVHT